MRLSYLIQDHFWLLVLVLLVPSAYLQARGATTLVAGALLPEEPLVASEVGAAASRRPAEVVPPGHSAVRGQAIVERNLFDSVVAARSAEPAASAAPERPIPTNPLEAPKCEDVWVTSTMVDDDPLRSTAVLREADAKQGAVARVGDDVGGRTLAYIGFNPLERSPVVWLEGGEGLCQTVLFGDGPPKAKKPRRKVRRKRRAKRRAARARRRRRPPPVPKTIARRIQRLSATEYRIDRSAVDDIMEQQAKLMRSVRIRPNQKDGRTTSLRLSRVTPRSLLGTLGLKNGDRIISLNGFDLTSPERALEAYARLRSAEELNLQLKRAGEPVTISYQLE